MNSFEYSIHAKRNCSRHLVRPLSKEFYMKHMTQVE